LHDDDTPREAIQGLQRYFEFYNRQRLHQALDDRTPVAVYYNSLTSQTILFFASHCLDNGVHLTPNLWLHGCFLYSRQRFSQGVHSMLFRHFAIVILAVASFGIGPAGAQDEIPFPAHASDLGDNSYWNVSNVHSGNARDLNVARKTNSGWSHLDADGGSENTDVNAYAVPLYAPADGEIITCWRNHPNNPRPGAIHCGRCCANNWSDDCDDAQCPKPAKCTIATSGNHIGIQKSNGDYVLLAHLKPDSIPSSLCPRSAQFMNDAFDKPGGEFPKESYFRLCKAGEDPQTDQCVTSRPTVTRGQFVGRVGNSGASSGPHLHIQTGNIAENADGFFERTGPLKPFKFAYGWQMKRATSSVWNMLTGNETGLDKQDLIQASPFLRRAESSAGAILETATLFLSGNRAVTASVATSNKKVKLITWDLVGLSTLNRKHDIEDVAAQAVHLTEPASDTILAAIHRTDGKLSMAVFSVVFTGGLVRRDERTFGQVSHLDMANTRGPDHKAVTAFRDADGKLKLIAWDVAFNSGNVSIERLGEKVVNPVSTVKVARASVFNGVFTATTDSSGELKVIPWTLSADGMTFTRGNAVTAGKVTGGHMDVAPLSQGVAVAVKDGDGKLRVMTWTATPAGDIQSQRRSTRTTGKVTNISLLTPPHGGSNLATVVRGDNGDLYVIGWAVDGDGRNLRRLGSSKAGDASHISAAVHSRSYVNSDPRDIILTSMRDSDGNLKLITWDTNLVKP
jgi:hypothetical protein